MVGMGGGGGCGGVEGRRMGASRSTVMNRY